MKTKYVFTIKHSIKSSCLWMDWPSLCVFDSLILWMEGTIPSVWLPQALHVLAHPSFLSCECTRVFMTFSSFLPDSLWNAAHDWQNWKWPRSCLQVTWKYFLSALNWESLITKIFGWFKPVRFHYLKHTEFGECKEDPRAIFMFTRNLLEIVKSLKSGCACQWGHQGFAWG